MHWYCVGRNSVVSAPTAEPGCESRTPTTPARIHQKDYAYARLLDEAKSADGVTIGVALDALPPRRVVVPGWQVRDAERCTALFQEKAAILGKIRTWLKLELPARRRGGARWQASGGEPAFEHKRSDFEGADFLAGSGCGVV